VIITGTVTCYFVGGGLIYSFSERTNFHKANLKQIKYIQEENRHFKKALDEEEARKALERLSVSKRV